VWIDWRYLGAFLTLFWIAVFCSLEISDYEWRHRITVAASVAILIVLGGQIAEFTYTKVRQRDAMVEHVRVVNALRALGIGSGSPVASIGDANQAYWARLGRLRIVGEIPWDVWDPVVRMPEVSDVEIFWLASGEEKAAVIRKLAETGAKAIVARDVPPGTVGAGWQRVAGTPYSVYHF
jgi:hypothetical protein